MDQIDFSKLYCKQHPYELVTNFCCQQRCLIGLCATCICSHTEMHSRTSTSPKYQNIRDTFTNTHQTLRQYIGQIQNDKCRLNRLSQNIQTKKNSMKKLIKQVREDTISRINEDFDLLQKKILSDVLSEEKKNGYHCAYRLEVLNKSLIRQTQNLLNYVQQMNSTNFLNCCRNLKKDGFTNALNYQARVNEQLLNNQHYVPNLIFNSKMVEQISNSTKKMFSLQFIIPKITENQASLIHKQGSDIKKGGRSLPKSQSMMILTNNNSMYNFNRTSTPMKNSSFLTQTNNFNLFKNQSCLDNRNSSTISSLSSYYPIVQSYKNKQNIRNISIQSNNSDIINRESLINKLGYSPKAYKYNQLNSISQQKNFGRKNNLMESQASIVSRNTNQ